MNKKDAFKKIRKDSTAISIACVICIFLSILTRTLCIRGNTEYSFLFVFVSVVASVISGRILGIAAEFLYETTYKNLKNRGIKEEKSWFVFPAAFAVFLLSYLPCFLAFYPGIAAYDSYIQIHQIFENSFNDHHPLFHTLMIKAALLVGEKMFQSLNAGIALYVIVQCILLAAVFAYGIYLLHKKGMKTYSFAAMIFIAIYPFNAFMAISVTKDIPFSAFFLLNVLLLIRIITKGNLKKKIPAAVLLFVSTIMCVLFRNNGKFAIIPLLFALLVSVIAITVFVGNRKEEKKDLVEIKKNMTAVICIVSIGVFAGLISLSIASKALSAQQGDKREMLSVPIQQIARTYVYHKDELDEESKALINEFILYDGADDYNPSISDPVKSKTNTWVAVNKKKEFVKTYLKLFKIFPGDYINAFLALNAGFIDVGDESHAHINESKGQKGLGYVQTKWSETLYERGFFEDSKLPALKRTYGTFANDNAYLKIPVIKYLFMPGIFLWICVALTIYSIKRKNICAVAPLSLIAGYYATMFFGPCVQLRYVYPVMICVPFLLPMIFKEIQNDNGQE